MTRPIMSDEQMREEGEAWGEYYAGREPKPVSSEQASAKSLQDVRARAERWLAYQPSVGYVNDLARDVVALTKRVREIDDHRRALKEQYEMTRAAYGELEAETRAGRLRVQEAERALRDIHRLTSPAFPHPDRMAAIKERVEAVLGGVDG